MRTTYAMAPPFWKYPYTDKGNIQPGAKPPYSCSNWVQLVTRRGFTPFGSLGSSVGELAVKPTNAAIAVAAAERLFCDDGTSST
jgi:hypothetical protein